MYFIDMDNNTDQILYFAKYQAAGDHFIVVNNTKNKYPFLKDKTFVPKICDSNFGVGGNGVIELLTCSGYDYEMKFHNVDGSTGTVCGNGSRCAAIFAFKENIVLKDEIRFKVSDHAHIAKIIEKDPVKGIVEVKIMDIYKVKKMKEDYYVDTGSPHYVRFVQSLINHPIASEGEVIRNSIDGGVNANFVSFVKDKDTGKMTLHMRTYERETHKEILACGTGAVAAALAAHHKGYGQEENG